MSFGYAKTSDSRENIIGDTRLSFENRPVNVNGPTNCLVDNKQLENNQSDRQKKHAK